MKRKACKRGRPRLYETAVKVRMGRALRRDLQRIAERRERDISSLCRIGLRRFVERELAAIEKEKAEGR